MNNRNGLATMESYACLCLCISYKKHSHCPCDNDIVLGTHVDDEN